MNYIYDLADFVLLPNGTPPSASGLEAEIGLTSLSGIYRGGVFEVDEVTFTFTRTLTSPEELVLDAVVAAHLGVDAEGSPDVEDVEGSPIVNVTTINGLDFNDFSSDTTNHVSNENNPHGTSIGNLENGSLAELNAKVTDATLDTSTAQRPPSTHGSRHNRTGNDPLTVQDLGSGSASTGQRLSANGSGGWSLVAAPSDVTDHGNLLGLGDDDHPQYFRADGGRSLAGTLNAGGNAITNVGLVDGIDVSVQAATSNAHIARTDNPHGTDIGNLGSGTLAELNSKVTNATLDDSSASRPPSSHASTHSQGGSDALLVQDLGSGAAASGQIFVADGAGGVDLATFAGADTIPSFSAYNSANLGTLTTSYQGIALDSENVKDAAAFSHAGTSAGVTILKAGLYAISGYATVDMSNSVRSQSSMRVTVNRGGGFVQVPGMFGIMYHRTSAQAGNSSSATQDIDLDVGDIVRLELKRDSGTGVLFPVGSACGLVLRSLEGLRGPQGEPGSGVSVDILEGGASVGSFTELSFDSSDFDVVDAGSGRATVDVTSKVSLQTVSETMVTQTSTSYVTLQTLTVPKAGVYHVIWGGVTDVTQLESVFYKVFVNGVEQAGTEARFTQTQIVSAVVTVPISYITENIAANSTVSVRWSVSGGIALVNSRRLQVLER